MNVQEYEQIQPHVNIDGAVFLTPNSHCLWRAQTLFSKEPDTIEWIRSMKSGETLFDVGANIGQYSIFAARHGVKVHAFEPESQNFALLCRNIAINKLENVTAWPFCLSDEPEIAVLYLSSMIAGGSCHSFGKKVGYNGQEKPFKQSQGSIAVVLDDFAEKFGLPDHVKLDVDGFEHKVLAGSKVILTEAKSVLVEINRNMPQHMAIFDLMRDNGFVYDGVQAEEAKRTEGPFKDIGNVIFKRR